MKIEEFFRQTLTQLRAAKIETPDLEANWLIARFTKLNSVDRMRRPDHDLKPEEMAQVAQAIERRLSGEPLAYILNEQEFFGYKFYVDKNVLIPRPETELLVSWAMDWAKEKLIQNNDINILDLGTGSGCIGIALLKGLLRAKLVAVDKSSSAIEVAKKNASSLGVIGRCEFINQSIEELVFQSQFDLILANPPYIDNEDQDIDAHVKKYEPHEALFAEENGLGLIKGWLKKMPQALKPQAAVGFEIGARQGNEVLSLFRDLQIFSKQYILQDYAGHDRFVIGER